MVMRPLWPSIAWALLILALYSIPGSDLALTSFWDFFGLDKVLHMIVFSLWTPMLIVALAKQPKAEGKRIGTIKISLLIGVVYGVILELIQGTMFVQRVTDEWDMLANVSGVFLGLVIFRIVYGREGLSSLK